METIRYVDRASQEEKEERVYGGFFIRLLYGKRPFLRFLLPLIAKTPLFSQLYALLQKSSFSRFKVQRFIRNYHVDASEFEKSPKEFTSFNDFFTRRLKPGCRPLAGGREVAVLPADARYLVYPRLEEADGLVVKGKRFSLEELLQNKEWLNRYRDGSLVLARLSPVDYHRFHFPVDGIPGDARLINGTLYSVNPLALKRNSAILAQNKRMITEIKSGLFGTLLFIEVGATYVGTIVQTYRPRLPCAKGEEKGYFSFGGSSLLLLFERGAIRLDSDLLKASKSRREVRALMGQSLGSCS
ncbi:MAG: phosphatidylserine decarboxylase [Chlamydiae bacterium GWC2_50_10]|nr:MAG: phosphatidylserine decarboxylase [Chlamydiae bacterium GWA2_50_15]OGN53977.1 MAG: phosphatidylserine decarboxylase [Chlamydiae bacterium GWC2_50_10]OGN54148.1 MAG: phosphatidylserine decarboxylase [Chlamydiae bacterium GWF2_49_8]OGN58192.1 MAG: phosphatidylserine decarboxylase [Chlamydiae bacterium RIFCSPHIGHO2_02_FULL_49_29]OGN70811.1 MAG: phosphatidylserine decarboxylase [Chlamydiae bacterium RIFCSPLOWO2_02_FULL_49_12]OGN73331.1 MAG: phosphatidylserine decarboxylase [Chlamydiae bacte